ncbi:hypothetical protein OQA88_12355 [Cercophora sp. LCS_1]
MSAQNSRKRAAPGATPMGPVPPLSQPFNGGSPDAIYNWAGNPGPERSGFVETGSPTLNSFNMISQPEQYGVAAPSTALARRQPNRALVHPKFGPDSWDFTDDSSFLQPNGTVDENDSVERLEEMALRAKRELQEKRKQIPPFVQKLSSFLDDSSKTHLIRWSEKGDSFIVLDEDEFAKTLIPELFKHNNYASFVRQLNMYGFHKRVGLSDNSMKASERKNKSPSEYYNPYFRRGHPNLLWLINKPKSTNSKKKNKKQESDGDTDDEGTTEAFGGANVGAQSGRGASVAHEVGPLQKKDLVQVKSQIERLQQQQIAISNMLNKMRQDHNALYSQAVTFQTMHDRHENSINAILTFLANVFRKSLEEQGGAHSAQSVQELLQSMLPTGQAQNQTRAPPTVVDLGDYVTGNFPNAVSTISTPKRQQRLLPPPVTGKASTVSPTSTAAPTPQPYQGPQMGSVTELFDTSPADTSSPAYIKDELRTNPQEGMMKIIHNTNAVSTPGVDLPDIANNTNVSMTNDQRNKMIDIMNGQVTSAGSPTIPSPTPSMQPPVSLSPILGSIPPPPPDLSAFRASQAEIDTLQQLSNQTANGINQLQSFLGPLSPSGRIPGLDSDTAPNGDYFDLDYSQYLNNDAFATSNFGGAQGLAGDDFNFALDGSVPPGGDTGGYVSAAAVGGQQPGYEAGRVFETGSASTPSETGTEEIPRGDFGVESPERENKRRRKA